MKIQKMIIDKGIKGDVDDNVRFVFPFPVPSCASLTPTHAQRATRQQVRARADELEAKCRAQEQRIQKLEKQTQLLTAQNTALKKNISCLYKTAKLEIERKDQEIARLRRPSHPSSTS